MPHRSHVQKLINSYTRRLQKLQEAQSYTGIETSPHVLIEIEDIEAKLESLKAELALLPEDRTDQPDLPSDPLAPFPLSSQDSIVISNTKIQGDVVSGGKKIVNTGGAPYIKDTTINTGGGHVEVVGKKNVIISVPLALLALALLVILVTFTDAVQRARSGVLASVWPLPTSTFTPSLPTPTFTPIPPMPNNDFNIGVAQFTEKTAADTLEVTEVSREFSDFLFTVLDDIPKQDMAAQVREPQLIGMVSGQDFTARAREAERIAPTHNADLIIFGVISSTGQNNYLAELEFYVSPETHSGFDYGSEIIGAQQFTQFKFFLLSDSPPKFDSPPMKAQLQDRVKILQHVVTGLHNFYWSDYTNAWAEFYQASEGNATGNVDSLPILHLLMGSAKLQNCEPKLPKDEKTHLLNEAESQFRQALELNKGIDYPRSYLGLGIVSFQQATSQTTSITSTDAVKLAEAKDWFIRAQDTGDQTAQIQEKAAFGLAQTYYAGVTAGLPGYSIEQMNYYFNQVLDAYQKNPINPLLTSQAAHVHAYRGWLAGNGYDWALMSSEFRKAISALDSLPSKPYDWLAWYWHFVAIAEEKQGDKIKAREAYQNAVELGGRSRQPGAFSPEDLAKWQVKLAN